MHDNPEKISQPFLPRIGMIWFFISVTMVALALGIIRAAEQGRALAAAMVVGFVFAVMVALVSGMCFLIAFMFGATEKRLAPSKPEVASPFADNTLPDQIIPPRTIEND